MSLQTLPMVQPVNVVVLAGGFGGARMADGFQLLGDSVSLSVIGNTGDDLEVHGLHVSPDLDTVMYTLAGLANDETGWGVRDETWSAATMLERYGAATWFALGDRDLGTHVIRTERLRSGQRLTDVTKTLRSALGVKGQLLPMSDDPVRTKVLTADGWLDFQDYFVRRRHLDDVRDIRFDGIEAAAPTPEVLAAIERAEVIVIAPSNPYVSVAPILSLKGVVEALERSDAVTIAVSPIVGGSALRGPAAQMMQSLGGIASVTGIAEHYATRYPRLVDVLVIDDVDAAEQAAVAQHGFTVVCAPIVIPDSDRRAALAETLIGATSDWRQLSRSG